MLAPKRVQWRKVAKGKMRGIATRGNTIQFGEYGLVAIACGKITARQIEAARIAMSRSIKRGGNVWIRIFPDKPITKKAAETRMGSGKGNVEEWAAVIKPGRVLYEIGGIPANEAVEALRLAGHKLPVKCKPMTKDQLFKRNVERKVPMRKSAILSNTGATRLPQTPVAAK